MQQTIQPGDQMWVNFADLIHNRVPDRNGNVLPPDASSGTYELEDANGGYGLLQDSFALNGIWGNQAQQPPLPECCGYTGVGFDPNEVDFGVLGINDPLIVAATDQCSGGNSNISSFFTDWWSGNPSVAQVSREQVTSVGFGSTDANASGLVGYCMGDTEYWQEQYPVDPVTVQKPTSLKVLSSSVVPITGLEKCILADYGIAIAVHYQVLDQNGQPIESDSMVPQEQVINVSVNGSQPYDPFPNWENIGPNLGMSDQYTDASGTFWDDPNGACTNFAFTETSQQPISMLLSGINYTVRTENWTIISNVVGHGSMSNGGDIKLSY
jgi:hypothetical protein